MEDAFFVHPLVRVRPESVVTESGALTHEIETEDTALALIQIASGAMATLVGTTSFHTDRPGDQYGSGALTKLEVGGTDGAIVVADDTLAMAKLADGSSLAPIELPAANAFQGFARWVRDDTYASPTPVKARDGRKSIALIEAIYRSARTSERVVLGE